eukprot:3251582-Prymnesium_polylepis.1
MLPTESVRAGVLFPYGGLSQGSRADVRFGAHIRRARAAACRPGRPPRDCGSCPTCRAAAPAAWQRRRWRRHCGASRPALAGSSARRAARSDGGP